MKADRKLVLRRERFTEIEGDALQRVAGATHFCGVTHDRLCAVSNPATACVTLVWTVVSRQLGQCACAG